MFVHLHPWIIAIACSHRSWQLICCNNEFRNYRSPRVAMAIAARADARTNSRTIMMIMRTASSRIRCRTFTVAFVAFLAFVE